VFTPAPERAQSVLERVWRLRATRNENQGVTEESRGSLLFHSGETRADGERRALLQLTRFAVPAHSPASENREERLMKNVKMLCAIAVAVGAGMAPSAQGQSYPVKPVRFIIPFPPGGGTDTMARIMAPKLSEALGQQVVVDNRGGAGATIGTEIAAKSPPDGYTLLLMTVTNAVGMSLYSNLKYDLVRDFAPVTRVATTPHIIVVHPSVPAKTIKELVSLAKARPGALVYSSSGSGSVSHLGGEYFAFLTGTKMLHVPYKGGGPSVAALLAGEVSAAFATMPSVISYVKSGRVRALALTTARRSPSLPDLVTVIEAGIPNYDVGSWYGLSVPAGTSKEIITRLHAETVKLLGLPDVKQRLDASGFEVITSTPGEYGEFVRTEVERWAKVVKISGARAD
jgi:tripartite-type tricarboxylate transporter receptor subunit TctC